MRRGVYVSKRLNEALDLLPDTAASLKLTRLPVYRLDCSQIGQTRIYGNGWSFIVPRDAGAGAVLDGYNDKAAAISFGLKSVTVGEALVAQLLALYASPVRYGAAYEAESRTAA